VMFCDEDEAGFGWISAEPDWMGRASHAIAVDGGIWLVDPVDFSGLDERLRALGEPRGVLQLLDRHGRDSAAIAARLAVPHLITPDSVPGSPFRTIPIKAMRGWREVALWLPEHRTLVVGDALGTVRYFCAPGRPLGVHPVLRIIHPPTALLALEPEHILCGHGRGVHSEAAEALNHAVRYARRELPVVLARFATAKQHPVT
jgi:hypothetical protein